MQTLNVGVGQSDSEYEAFGVHAFFVFKWFQGQKALKDLHDAGGSPL